VAHAHPGAAETSAIALAVDPLRLPPRRPN
jgi:hypothetical protein